MAGSLSPADEPAVWLRVRNMLDRPSMATVLRKVVTGVLAALLLGGCRVVLDSASFTCASDADCAAADACVEGVCQQRCVVGCGDTTGQAGSGASASASSAERTSSGPAETASSHTVEDGSSGATASSSVAVASSGVAAVSSSSASSASSASSLASSASVESSSAAVASMDVSGAASSGAATLGGVSSSRPSSGIASSSVASLSSSSAAHSSGPPPCVADAECLERLGPSHVCDQGACVPGDCHGATDCRDSGVLCVNLRCSSCSALGADDANAQCAAAYGSGFACVAGSCACVPAPGACSAPPATCGTTTSGVDSCGMPCTKVGPAFCFTVHPACAQGGTGTNNTQCDTPRGKFDCDLTAYPPQCAAGQWPNSLGADCAHCVNIHCTREGGRDRSQFRCNNFPTAPTP